MNIYFVERTDEIGYDEFDSFVCVAHNEEEASRIHPSYQNNDFYKNLILPIGVHNFHFPCWAKSNLTLKITFIGKANNKYNKPEVICASFNAY